MLLLAPQLSCGLSNVADASSLTADASSLTNEILGDERAHVLERISQQQKEITSIRATIVQRKRHPLLKKDAVNEGVILFKKPNLLRWELDKPERMIIVIDGRTILSYYPNKKQAERKDLQENPTSRAAMEFLTSGMSVSVPELEKRFRVDLFREGGDIVLMLTPRSRWLARAIESIAIHQNEHDAIPRRIVFTGKKGDHTETELKDVIINPHIVENPFDLRMGPEVHVTDIGKEGVSRDDGP
jgi:outer membrane lipoprotein carrier protein